MIFFHNPILMIPRADIGVYLSIVPPVGRNDSFDVVFLKRRKWMPTCGMWVSFVWSERLGQHDCWITKPSCFLLGSKRDPKIVSRYQHNTSLKKRRSGKGKCNEWWSSKGIFVTFASFAVRYSWKRLSSLCCGVDGADESVGQQVNIYHLYFCPGRNVALGHV